MKHYQLPNSLRFKSEKNGKRTHLFFLKNKRGMEVAITDYGARVVSILVPDKNGKVTDIVLGFDSIKKYIEAVEPYYGATIGRFANRIANGTFKIKDKTYHITPNNGPNVLHGGETGFHHKIWDRRVNAEESIEFYIVSPDGEGGFPGNLTVSITYSINDNNELFLRYRAHSDQITIINLTNHIFFNLNGEAGAKITNHLVQINADAYLPVNAEQIPVGEIKPNEGSAFDFRKQKELGKMMEMPNEQLIDNKGYDHTFVLKKEGINKPAAQISSPLTGIGLEVFTTAPGMQFYTANYLEGKDIGKQEKAYTKHGALCLETQTFPDGPNHANFPSCEIHPGKPFTSETRFKFFVDKRDRLQ